MSAGWKYLKYDCGILGMALRWCSIINIIVTIIITIYIPYPLVNQHNYGKSHFLICKSTISTGPCSTLLCNSHYHRLTHHKPRDPIKTTIPQIQLATPSPPAAAIWRLPWCHSSPISGASADRFLNKSVVFPSGVGGKNGEVHMS